MGSAKKLRTISLCYGYGGIELGLELAGESIEHLAISEIEAYPIKTVIEKMEEGRMAPTPVWTDLKTFPSEVFRDVDLLTGGFPCQPFSAAGARAGDEDPRHLFPHILRIVEGCRPRRLFFENVEGIISAKLKSDGWADPAGTTVLLHVLRELERRGYSCSWEVFSASEVGAPHQRKRVFILAHRKDQLDNPCIEGLAELQKSELKDHLQATAGGCEELADTNSDGGREDREQTQLRTDRTQQPPRHRWPSRPREAQQEWEEPRTIDGKLNPDWVEQLMGLPVGWTGDGSRIDRLRLLGNGVVPQTAAKAWRILNHGQ